MINNLNYEISIWKNGNKSRFVTDYAIDVRKTWSERLKLAPGAGILPAKFKLKERPYWCLIIVR